eukprot:1367924-Pleurochrysis_carterae.AAC.1
MCNCFAALHGRVCERDGHEGLEIYCTTTLKTHTYIHTRKGRNALEWVRSKQGERRVARKIGVLGGKKHLPTGILTELARG